MLLDHLRQKVRINQTAEKEKTHQTSETQSTPQLIKINALGVAIRKKSDGFAN